MYACFIILSWSIFCMCSIHLNFTGSIDVSIGSIFSCWFDYHWAMTERSAILYPPTFSHALTGYFQDPTKRWVWSFLRTYKGRKVYEGYSKSIDRLLVFKYWCVGTRFYSSNALYWLITKRIGFCSRLPARACRKHCLQ